MLNTGILILGVWKFPQTAQQKKNGKFVQEFLLRNWMYIISPKETGTLLRNVYLGNSNWFVSPADYNQPGTKPTQI